MKREIFLGLAALTLVASVFAETAAAEADGMTAEQILARYVEARGGAEALAALQTVVADGTAILPNGVETPFHYEWKRPDRFRFELTFQGTTEIQAFDGESGWELDPPATEPTPMAAPKLALLNDAVDFVGPLVSAADKGYEVELLGKESVEGTEAWALGLVRNDHLEERYYLDTEYYLEIQQRERHLLGGQQVDMEVTWGDYKEVAGVLVPHTWSRRRAGESRGLTLVFESFTFNAELPDARFAMP